MLIKHAKYGDLLRPCSHDEAAKLYQMFETRQSTATNGTEHLTQSKNTSAQPSASTPVRGSAETPAFTPPSRRADSKVKIKEEVEEQVEHGKVGTAALRLQVRRAESK